VFYRDEKGSLMANLKIILVIGILVSAVVTGVFNFANGLNSVSTYHQEPLLSNNSFAEAAYNSSLLNQNISNGMMKQFANLSTKQDWTVIFGLASLTATTFLGALQQALFIPAFFGVMLSSVGDIVNAFVDISLLINLIGYVAAIYLTFKVFEFFFLSGR
jgi:hypothetical protein